MGKMGLNEPVEVARATPGDVSVFVERVEAQESPPSQHFQERARGAANATLG